MPADVSDRYIWLRNQVEAGKGKKGKGKGKKRKGKGNGKGQKLHQMKRGTFNVYFYKRFGSKALFFHFVKVGTKDVSVSALLEEWQRFKTTSDYAQLSRRKKTPEEKGLKAKRDRLRWELKVKKKQKASDSEIERLQQEVAHAETDYASTGRSGKRACVASYLK